MPSVPWQVPFAVQLSEGLSKLGIASCITEERQRTDFGFPILLGTTFWRDIEQDGQGDWLLVDRASFGDPQFVQLVWNGHGRRGDHKVPENASAARWGSICPPVQPLRSGDVRILCGQHRTYSPHFATPADWYRAVQADAFRPHPAVSDNPTGLPVVTSWDDATAHVLNSSVGIDCLINGVPVVEYDQGFMGWGWRRDGREAMFHWLAWTQWHHHEIRQGEPIRHLFE